MNCRTSSDVKDAGKKHEKYSVFECESRRTTHPEGRFFRFPKDDEMSKKWATVCKNQLVQSKSAIELYKSYRVCSEHFEQKDYSSEKMYHLRRDAYPSLLVHEEIDIQKMKNSISDKLAIPQSTSPTVGLKRKYDEIIEGSLDSENQSENPSASFDLAQVQTSTPKKQKFHPLLFATPKAGTRKNLTPKTAKIKSLATKLYFLKRKFSKIEEKKTKTKFILQEIKKIVPPIIYNFISSQLRSTNVSAHERSWTVNDKNLALQVYLASPQAYNTLSKLFYFPSKKTLQRNLAGISVQPGFVPAVFNALKLVAAKMKEHNRLCVLAFDEVKLHPGLAYNAKNDLLIGYECYGSDMERSSKLATHALVFMVRGVCQKWKQVVGSFFSSSTTPSFVLKTLVFDAVKKLTACGLRPIAIVCDMGSNNQQLLLKDLQISEENPYFQVESSKIYTIFDPPHLLKCLRNNFSNYNAKFGDDKVASWEHIVELWKIDHNCAHRAVPKLTKRHVHLTGFSKMNVKLAAQVLSESVSGGLCWLALFNALPASANNTVDFCSISNKMFDSMNSRLLKHKNPLLAGVTKESIHFTQWKTSMDFIKSIEFHTDGKKIKFPCFQGFKITFSAFLQLVPELLEEIPFVLMSRFNQDCLENFFSQVRKKGGNNDHPTPVDFLYRLRLLLAENLMHTWGNANCEPDNDALLLPVEMLASSNDTSFNRTLIIDEPAEISLPEVNSEEGFLAENSGAYVAGYIAKKVMMKFPCRDCSDLLQQEKCISQSTVLIYLKEFEYSKNGLKYPSENLIKTVVKFRKIFKTLFSNICFEINISKKLTNELLEVNHDWLTCSSHMPALRQHLVQFYVKVMLYYKVKFLNKEIPNKKKAIQKLKKLQ